MIELEVILILVFTMINRSENLAEGAGADRLLLVICRKGSGQIMPTRTGLRASKNMLTSHQLGEEQLNQCIL